MGKLRLPLGRQLWVKSGSLCKLRLNIAINGGQQQPAPFQANEPFELEDANGEVTFVTVKLIAGRTSRLQYLRHALD